MTYFMGVHLTHCMVQSRQTLSNTATQSRPQGMPGQSQFNLIVHAAPLSVFPEVTVTDNHGPCSTPCSVAPADFSPVPAHPQHLITLHPNPDLPWDLQQSTMENRCPLSYRLTLGAILQVCPPSFNFRETLSWHKPHFFLGRRVAGAVVCALPQGGCTTVQRSGQHCPLKSPQAGLLRLPIPNPVRKWKEAHTTNGYSPPVKTVGIQGHLETLLYPCLHSKMTK